MWIFWLIASGIFFIGEMATTGFLIFWLGFGALAAMGVSFLTTNLLIQLAVFAIVSILLIILTKPLVNKYIHQGETVPTNAYSIIGKKGIVTKQISNIDGVGQVKIGGEIWSAVSCDNTEIAPDTEVTVKKIEGVKVVVTKL